MAAGRPKGIHLQHSMVVFETITQTLDFSLTFLDTLSRWFGASILVILVKNPFLGGRTSLRKD